MTDNPRLVRLQGDLPRSAHSIEYTEEGTLVADLYDFSEKANDMLGGDVAWIITVPKEAVPQVVALLKQESALQDSINELPGTTDDPMLDFLPLLPLQFKHIPDFQKWLERNGISYTKERDPWP